MPARATPHTLASASCVPLLPARATPDTLAAEPWPTLACASRAPLFLPLLPARAVSQSCLRKPCPTLASASHAPACHDPCSSRSLPPYTMPSRSPYPGTPIPPAYLLPHSNGRSRLSAPSQACLAIHPVPWHIPVPSAVPSSAVPSSEVPSGSSAHAVPVSCAALSRDWVLRGAGVGVGAGGVWVRVASAGKELLEMRS